MDRGERQREVRLRQARDDLPLERLVVGDGARAIGGAQQQRERELCGARPAVAPPEPVRRVPGHGKRLAGVESPAGEVDLTGLPLALNEVEHGRGLLTGHARHLAGCRAIAQLLYRVGNRGSLSTLC